jgi:hypothetical protein
MVGIGTATRGDAHARGEVGMQRLPIVKFGSEDRSIPVANKHRKLYLSVTRKHNDVDIVDILFPLSLAFRLVVINVAPSHAYWFKVLATRLQCGMWRYARHSSPKIAQVR